MTKPTILPILWRTGRPLPDVIELRGRYTHARYVRVITLPGPPAPSTGGSGWRWLKWWRR